MQTVAEDNAMTFVAEGGDVRGDWPCDGIFGGYKRLLGSSVGRCGLDGAKLKTDGMGCYVHAILLLWVKRFVTFGEHVR